MMTRLALRIAGFALILAIALPITSFTVHAQAPACSATITVRVQNTTPEERTARLRVIDTAQRGAIVAGTELLTLSPGASGDLTLLVIDVLGSYTVMFNRAGMRIVQPVTVAYTDPACDDLMQVFIGDGRINDGFDQRAAPIAGYCTRSGGIDLYDIDNRGHGTLAVRVTAERIKTGLETAIATGVNVLLGEGLGNAVYALSSNEIMLWGFVDYNPNESPKLYDFIVPGDVCALR